MRLDTEKVRDMLRAKNMTQSDLADALGVRPQGVFNILRPDGKVTLRTVQRLSDALGIPGKELITEEEAA